MSELENEVKKEIKVMLDDFEAYWFMPFQVMGKSGIPDFAAGVPMIIRPEHVGKRIAVFTLIEAKRLKKKPTALQAIHLQDAKDAGGVSCYIHGTRSEPGNFLAVESNLKKIFR